MNIRVFLLIGLGALGLVCGYAGNRILCDRPIPGDSPAVSGMDRSTRSGTIRAEAEYDVRRPQARVRSSDTLGALVAAGSDLSYGRLASWLMDATEPEIAAYWEAVKDVPRPNDITDLIFVHWTRLDPRAVIAAVAGTGAEHHAWRAWACHDPGDALRSAIDANPDRVNNVVRGIGEFHPQWLLDHFDEIPESGRGDAISSLAKLDGAARPLEVLNFLKRHGVGFSPTVFAALIRKDPLEAFGWMRENGEAALRNYGSGESAMRMLVDTMAESSPGALERLVSQTPSGELKRRMEAALFDRLLETDPDAALGLANDTKAPVIAVRRLAAVGLSRLKDDPDQAFEIARKMFAHGSDVLNPKTVVQGPHGSYSSSGPMDSAASGFVDALMEKDPAQVMALLSPPSGRSSGDFNALGSKWAKRDLAGYSDWVNRQTDPAVWEAATLPVVHELVKLEQFADAAKWMMTSTIAKSRLSRLFYQWQRSDPAGARQWLESADLPAGEKARYLQPPKNTP